MEVLTSLGVANLKDFSSGSGSKFSRFVEIIYRDGGAKLVKKSSDREPAPKEPLGLGSLIT